MEIELGIKLSEFVAVDGVRLVVELGFDVSTGIEDTVPEVMSGKIGEAELTPAEIEPLEITAPPGDKGVVTGTTTSIVLDVRKQTSHCVRTRSILWS